MIIFYLIIFGLFTSTIANDLARCSGPGELPVEGGIIRDKTNDPSHKVPGSNLTITYYFPFKILFVHDPNIKIKSTRDNLKKLETSVNQRLSAVIKAPRLKDVRLSREMRIIGRTTDPSVKSTTKSTTKASDDDPNKSRDGSVICRKPTCYGEYFPEELYKNYAKPCALEDGNESVLPEEVQKHADKYSLVIFTFVVGQGAGIFKDHCKGYKKMVFGAHCREDVNGRPTHGRLMYCASPNGLADEVSMVLHEVLHIMTGYNLVNMGNPLINCTAGAFDNPDFEYCMNKTWDQVEDERMNEKGKDYYDRIFSITPTVKRVAQEYFNCSTLEGAELNRWGRDNDLDALAILDTYGHWNYRLFHDEILSPVISPSMRLSNLTLAALNDTQWYRVNMSKAEPLLGRPKQRGCDVARKSCFSVIKDIRATDSRQAAPYCNDSFDHSKVILQSYCSDDGKTRLTCQEASTMTDNCQLLVEARQEKRFIYDSPVCELATTQPPEASLLGGMFGPGSICVTFPQIAQFPIHLANTFEIGRGNTLVMCAERECDNVTQTVIVLLNPGKAICKMNCSQAMAGKVAVFHPDSECQQWLGGRVSVICPDYREVCANYKPFPKDPIFEPPACPTPVTYVPPVITPCPTCATCPPCSATQCPTTNVTDPLHKEKPDQPQSEANDPPKSQTVITVLSFMISLASTVIVQKLF